MHGGRESCLVEKEDRGGSRITSFVPSEAEVEFRFDILYALEALTKRDHWFGPMVGVES